MTASSPPPPAAPTLARLVATMARLTILVERETAVLETPGMPGLAALQEEKSRLTQAYATSTAEIGARSGALDTLAPRLKAEMRSAATRLAQALIRNEKALSAMTNATDRVLGTIIHALKQQRGTGATYAPRRAGVSRCTLPSGMTLDQRF